MPSGGTSCGWTAGTARVRAFRRGPTAPRSLPQSSRAHLKTEIRPGNRLAELWGLAGVAVLFGFAIFRLGARGLATPFGELNAFEWGALGASVVFFVYGEGVLALQRRWVPRVLERVRCLRKETGWAFQVFAPLYAMSMIGASRRRMVSGWVLFLGVAVLAITVQRLPSPWRGIVDLGVAGALGIGLVSLLAGAVRNSED